VGRALDPYGQPPLPINLMPAKIPVSTHVNFPSFGVIAQLTTAFQSLNTVVLVRVDAITYLFLGYANTINVTVNLTNTLITPTQTKLIADAGNMQFNLTFLNPIEVRAIGDIYLLLLLLNFFYSPETGSSNQCHSHTFH
jgi:hypothetical protein